MITDVNNIFSNAQAITASADSTNILDLGAPGTPYGSPVPVEQDIGKVYHIPIYAAVTAAFNNLTSLAVSLQTSPDASAWTEVATRTYTLAQLTAGVLNFPAQVPVGANARYLKIAYTVTGTAPTQGAIWAGIVAGRQSNLH